VILTKSTWKNIYWIPLGLQVATLVLVFLFYRPIDQRIREEGDTTFQQFCSLNVVGLLFFGTVLLAFLLGISFGGQIPPWYVSCC
jgi:hypothetical protein